jgi:hypothetical protein
MPGPADSGTDKAEEGSSEQRLIFKSIFFAAVGLTASADNEPA